MGLSSRPVRRAKRRNYNDLVLIFLTGCMLSCGGGGSGAVVPMTPVVAPEFETKAALGEKLFADTNLSASRSQSCATCHNPAVAFIDDRPGADGSVSAVSLGDDGISIGDRNSPTVTYARFTPAFSSETHARFNSQQPDYSGFVGGQFLDGRANTLADQAAVPILNPVEMGMMDKASVVLRLQENQGYVEAFQRLYSHDIFDDVEAAYAAMTESIAVFEQGDQFAAFDSKYDRSLRGEYSYDPLSKAALGKSLFFSQQFTNCATCHQLHPNGHKQELFTNFEYHNIGVPENQDVRALNGMPTGFVDQGLLDNPGITGTEHRGKFKVPTLRNVAVTAPYMHNGVFRELKTVIEFYDHFLSNSDHVLNPETGLAWRDPEVPSTVSTRELADGPKLSAADIEGLVCFLRTLTDARYEHLIENNGVDCRE